MFMNLFMPVLSLSWWKLHWYKVVIGVLVVLVWLLSNRGSRGVSGFTEKVKDIKEKSREKILDLEIKYEREKLGREIKAREAKEDIKNKADKELAIRKEEIKSKLNKIRGNSKKINEKLNSIFKRK